MTDVRPNRTLGPVHDDFWAYCSKGELRLQRCSYCRHIPWPPVQACESCGRSGLTWERLSGRGKVISWCTFEHRYYKEVPIPWEVILVELEEGPLFVSNPKGFACRDITPNMPVKFEFIDCEDAAGSFRLPVFGKA